MATNPDESTRNLLAKIMAKPSNSRFEFQTPLKRSHSSSNSVGSSLDDPSPLKRTKMENKMDINYMASPREMRRIRSDLLESRNTILSLENNISHMHGVRKEMQLMFDNENSSLRRQHEYDAKTITSLETQLQDLRRRETILLNELNEVKTKLNRNKIDADLKVEDLERSMSELEEDTKQNNIEESIEIANLNRRIKELEVILQTSEDDLEAQKKLVAVLETRLNEKTKEDIDLEKNIQALQTAKLRIKELEYERENFSEQQELAKNNSVRLNHYIEMEKENEKLKEENFRLKDEVKNKLLLEEEVINLKNRLVKFKQQEKLLAEVQAQQQQNDIFLNEWRAVSRGICETSAPDSLLPQLLRSIVERLQQQEINLTAENVEMESKLKSALHEEKVAKSELEKIQKFLNDYQKTAEQKQKLIKTMQKKLLLISRERDSYRLQLDSYEKDLTMCVNTSNLASGAASQLQNQKERISRLEKIVDDYKDMVSRLENDLLTAQPGAYADLTSMKMEQGTRLQNEVDHLKAENERLRSRKDELEIKLENYLVGNDTLAGGQVYHNAFNPLANCVAERENLVEKLEQEVERLKRKCKNLQEGLEASKLGDMSICPQELQTLREQVKTHEGQMQKIKDYFKSSLSDFRNVIYFLFGYKIDKNGSNYKLRSTYAENESDYLCFQLNDDSDLNLLQNEYSATLEDMITLHLQHQKSFPVFLSALTMDLFSQKTKTFAIELD